MLLCSGSVVDLAYVKAPVFDRDVTDVDVTYNIAVNSHVLTNQKPEERNLMKRVLPRVRTRRVEVVASIHFSKKTKFVQKMGSMVGLANTTARRRVNLFNPGVYITLMISSETLIKAKTCYTHQTHH